MADSFTPPASAPPILVADGDGFVADVLVVGLGPGGATAALALAQYGVRVHAISMYPWVANSPRAHIFNQRAAEVMRDLGVEDEVRQQATAWDKMGDSLLTTSLAGPELLRIRAWGTGDDRHGDYVCASPSQMLDIPQPRLEPILVGAALRAGAILSFNTEYVAHTQDTDGVSVVLRDLRTGTEFTQRVRYLVGFDGARSQIAAHVDIPFVGELARAGTVYASFEADLSKYVAHRPSILHWIFNSDASHGEIGMGLLRVVEPWRKWIAGWGFDHLKGEPDTSEPTVLARIRALIGDPDIEIVLERVSTWYVNEQYATSYQLGRVLLGGDAVHRHPPSNGLGANTSIQDAFNLAWKLAYVVRGDAGSGLLESYSAERVPVGKQIVERANQSRRDFAGLREWFDGEADDPVQDGLQRLADRGEPGIALRNQLYEALAMKNYEFNAHGVEMNQRYQSRAVIPGDGPDEAFERDPELFAQPTTRPGAKLPHAWLVDEAGNRVSTLDLVGQGSFTVITGLAGGAWTSAVASIGESWLRVLVIGAHGAADPYGNWHALREIEEGGALLVRPDGYIAWRHTANQPDWTTAAKLLAGALSTITDSTPGSQS